jgi:hypothetical protein
MSTFKLAGFALALALTFVTAAFAAPKTTCCDSSKCKTACCKVACCDAPCCDAARAKSIKPGNHLAKATFAKLAMSHKKKQGSSCCAMPCCNSGACCSDTSCCTAEAKKA